MQRNDYIRLGEILSDKFILSSNMGLTSKQVSFWKSKQIIPFLERDQKGFLNIPEALWVLIVNELAVIGLDTKRIAKLASDIWEKPLKEKYADKVLERELVANRDLHELDKNWIKHFLSFEPIMDTVFRKEINPFTDSIKTCLFKGHLPTNLSLTKSAPPTTSSFSQAKNNNVKVAKSKVVIFNVFMLWPIVL